MTLCKHRLIKATTNSMHNEDPLGKSAWCKLVPWGYDFFQGLNSCDFFKVSILMTFCKNVKLPWL